MRRPERRHGDERPLGWEEAADGMDARDLERLSPRERREDAREPTREHRLPRARRAGQQHVVRTGRRDLESPARSLLAAYVREVRRLRRVERVRRKGLERGRVDLPAKVRDRLGKRAHRDGLDACESGFRCRFGGAHHELQARAPRSLGDCERADHGSDPAVEPELPHRGMAAQPLGWNLARGREHRERDRKVESRPLLAEGRRCEVDRDPACERPLELRRDDAAPNAMLRFLASTVDESDDRETRDAGLEMEVYACLVRLRIAWLKRTKACVCGLLWSGASRTRTGDLLGAMQRRTFAPVRACS